MKISNKRGRLFVFEGPDGFGKTTLASVLSRRLESAGIPTRLLSFPGQEPGTLGALVYRLHHKPDELGVRNIDVTALQILHLAAHVDNVRREIIPLLNDGIAVILDRFWWSLSVYGTVLGADETVIKNAVRIERGLFRNIQPTCIFLVSKGGHLREGKGPDRQLEATLLARYKELATKERSIRVVLVENIHEPRAVVDEAMKAFQGQTIDATDHERFHGRR